MDECNSAAAHFVVTVHLLWLLILMRALEYWETGMLRLQNNCRQSTTQSESIYPLRTPQGMVKSELK